MTNIAKYGGMFLIAYMGAAFLGFFAQIFPIEPTSVLDVLFKAILGGLFGLGVGVGGEKLIAHFK